MQTRYLFALLCWVVMWAKPASGATTLYPITGRDSTNAPRQQIDPRSEPSNPTSSEVTITLKPTAVAPKGASGSVGIKGRALTLHLSHLEPGRYDLQLLKGPGEVPEHLGSLTIADPTLGPDRQANDNKKEASANPESVLLQTDVQMILPSELSTTQIGSLRLLGAGGNSVLVGEIR